MIMGIPRPVVLTAALNGFEKTKREHTNLPLSNDEVITQALACCQAGASAVHLCLRDEHGRHHLKPDIYQSVIQQIRDATHDQLLIVSTSEKEADMIIQDQMEFVLQVKPDAVLFPLRDLLPTEADDTQETLARDFLDECRNAQIAVQFSLSQPSELDWIYAYKQYGLIPHEKPALLFELGKEEAGAGDGLAQLQEYLNRLEKHSMRKMVSWAVSANSQDELTCLTAAMAFGGHVKTGLEHNCHDIHGDVCQDNASQIEAALEISSRIARPPASKMEARTLLFAP